MNPIYRSRRDREATSFTQGQSIRRVNSTCRSRRGPAAGAAALAAAADEACRPNRGFTLIELLVAMAIVAVIGVIALGGLTTVIQQQTIAEERTQRWREIQFAMRIITQDLAQIHPRAARDESGETWMPSFLVGPNEPFAVELSRGGWANPANLPRGNVLRVAYDWEESEKMLVRFHWPAMDRTLATPPVRTELLTGVDDVEIRLLDGNGQWRREWPPLDMAPPVSLVTRPRLVEFNLYLEDFGHLWRTVEIGG